MNLHDRDNFRRGLKEGISQGIIQGSQQKAIETAKNMLQKNISVEVISECTGLSLDEIEIFSK
jgi:predicted transposase/invertase (TIGR01784 family)